MANTASPAQLITAQQFATMTPADQQKALANMSPAEQQQMQTAVAQQRNRLNQRYMALSIKKQAVCPPSSGSGTNQSYSSGQTLIYNFPTAQGAFVESLLVKLNLSVTFGAATGANPATSYTVNAGKLLALIDRVRVLYNGVQHSLRPFILPYLQEFRGYQRSRTGLVLAGQQVSSIQGAIESSNIPAPGAAIGAGTYTYVLEFRVPFNALHELDAAGLLPMMGAGTQGQVELICAPNPLGVDPIYNAFSATAGVAGDQKVTVTGTVEVDATYRDGTNYASATPLSLAMSGLPTIQYITDEVLSPLSAGAINRHKIATLLKHGVVLSVLVDGNQSTKFSAISNITGLELEQDAVGQNAFYRYGVGSSNISVYNWYEQWRYVLGQDFDEGIIPWIVSTVQGTVNPSNREGLQLLNMQPSSGGWTDVHHAYQLNSVGGVAGITPRVETFLVSINPAGLSIN